MRNKIKYVVLSILFTAISVGVTLYNSGVIEAGRRWSGHD